jgi:AcrR family transcriptional regulator
MTGTRARSERDKAARREAILDAARAAFDHSDFDAFTMDDVAGRLGLVKGTLYRYFPTREALLVAVLTDELGGWFDTVDRALDAPRPDVVDALIPALLARPRTMRLLAVLPTILEHNVPYEEALAFKEFVLTRCAHTGAALDAALGAADGEGARLLLRLNAAVIGLYHGAHPSPVIAAILSGPRFAPLRVDLGDELTHLATALVAVIPRTTKRATR